MSNKQSGPTASVAVDSTGTPKQLLVNDTTGGLVLDGTIEIGDLTIGKMIGGAPEPKTGTASNVAAAVVFTKITRSVFINNTGIANDLQYSFDNGVTYFVMPAEGSMTFLVDLPIATGVKVRCAAELTTTYEILGIVAEA